MLVKVSELPLVEQPREKLRRKGARALSDQELMAVLLGSGSRNQDVMRVASRIVAILDDGISPPDLDTLCKIDGVGPARAAMVAAALEFARRRIRPEGYKVNFPSEVLPLIRHFSDRKQEHLLCISMNGGNEVLKIRVVSVGLVDKTQVHPREVFADPITDRASAVIVAHNHPSGNLTPSSQDVVATRQLKEAGVTLGINLLDHIIFNARGYYSFLENGDL